MLNLILSRVLQGGFVLLIISALCFVLLAAAGGDALTALQGDPRLSEEAINSLRHVYGLDKPLTVRYTRWLAGVVRGDLGHSFFYQVPVGSIVLPRLFNTLVLAATAMSSALFVALALGASAVVHERTWLNRLCELIILFATSTPRIVVALVVLAVTARSSFFAVDVAPAGLPAGKKLAVILPPSLVLAVPLVALFLAQIRDGLRSALRREYVQVARAKGLSERVVILRHALRDALNPLITIFGYSLRGVVSGSVIVETVFGWTGLGQLSFIAVRNRDIPLLTGVVLATATAVLVGNLIADILLLANNPELRQARRNKIKPATAANPTIPQPT